ncbi:MAG TPA: STAS domain-containing protein [Isosphaeraceae bacterium]|jgi:anti-anti-sigma factor|nr:STAS domain-containing protein [Isosphaeraceae bacterium]
MKLVVVRGRPLGAEIPLRAGRFLIGRDRACHLRPRSPGVGGRQCAIERRGPHLVVRGLAGGTMVNGHDLDAGDVATLGDGDELGVGPLTFAVRVEPEPLPDEIDPLEWLTPNRDDPASASGLRAAFQAVSPVGVAAIPSRREEAAATTLPAPAFAYRQFDRSRGVVCVGIGTMQLLGDAEVRAARRALIELVERRGQARIVVDLSAVEMLPSLAVAALLALAARCRRAGGELRLCGAPEAVARLLERLKVDDPLADFADRAEALDFPWG